MKIIAENHHFIIIDKPHGVSVHNESPSLLEELKKLNLPDHFVNRLDKETSGLMVIARNPTDHQLLSESLSQGEKKYKAILRGCLSFDQGQWSYPVSDKSEGYKNPQGLKKDQLPSLTLVHVERKNKYLTEVTLSLQTGRQHQIRKHACLAGHPLLGDARYNEKKYNEKIFNFYPQAEKRMYLHAEVLNFEFNKEKYNFFSEGFNSDYFF